MAAFLRRLVQFFEALFGAKSQVAGAAAGIPLLEATAVSDEEAQAGVVWNQGGERAVTSRRDEPFLLSVDDAGQYLLVLGERVSLGHLRSGVADLLFLADVGAVHAHLERNESLTEGPVWSLVPGEGERCYLHDHLLEGPTRLTPGDRIRLGENLGFEVQRPDPASHTILLKLAGGAECGGAQHVVLFGGGEGGRIRIGAAAQRHVRVPNLEHEVTLIHRDGRIYAQCEGKIQGPEGSGESGEGGFSLPCPPPQRFDLAFGRPQGSRPPFGLAFEPSDLGEHRTGQKRS